MTIQLPPEIILCIFSLLPLSDLCQLLKYSQSRLLKAYCKATLLRQIKQQGKLDLYTPSDYFALLCNRDMISKPVLQLSCIAFSSQSLVFQATEMIEMTQGLRVYCPHWLKPFNEDDEQGCLDTLWSDFKQTKLQLVVSFNWFIQRMGIQVEFV